MNDARIRRAGGRTERCDGPRPDRQDYECPFEPDLWPHILDELAAMAEARGGMVFTANGVVLNWTASDRMHPSMHRVIEGDWLRKGERFRRLSNSRHAGFLTEHDIYAPDEMENDPFYRDLLWPAGFGWGVGMAIRLPTGDTTIFGLERARDRGPVEADVVARLDVLRPHLARSLLLSARLQLERARAATETLGRIGLPALVMDDRGKVLAANQLIEELSGVVRWLALDRLSLTDAAADALFRQAIEHFRRDDHPAVRSFAVRSGGGDTDAAMVAHVVPIRGSARDIFIRCAGMLVLTPVTLPLAPPVDLIKSLFDLTPAEARVAHHLAAGSTVGEIATSDGVSGNTVRTQVRGVLEKTGCRRQTEIVALLGGVSLQRR